jgi:hypothetical protein
LRKFVLKYKLDTDIKKLSPSLLGHVCDVERSTFANFWRSELLYIEDQAAPTTGKHYGGTSENT